MLNQLQKPFFRRSIADCTNFTHLHCKSCLISNHFQETVETRFRHFKALLRHLQVTIKTLLDKTFKAVSKHFKKRPRYCQSTFTALKTHSSHFHGICKTLSRARSRRIQGTLKKLARHFQSTCKAHPKHIQGTVKDTFQAHAKHFQDIFKVLSRHFPGTSKFRLRYNRDTYKTVSKHFQSTFKALSRYCQITCTELSSHLRNTFKAIPRHFQGIFEELSRTKSKSIIHSMKSIIY